MECEKPFRTLSWKGLETGSDTCSDKRRSVNLGNHSGEAIPEFGAL